MIQSRFEKCDASKCWCESKKQEQVHDKYNLNDVSFSIQRDYNVISKSILNASYIIYIYIKIKRMQQIYINVIMIISDF